MKIIGLTGGIASGKSTVSNILKEYGIPVIDADIISRDITKVDSEITKKIAAEFGKGVFNEDGTLNRKKLASIVFSDRKKLQRLNNITHPAIREEIEKKINDIGLEGYRLCVVDAALLIESGFYDLADIVIIVYAEPQIQLERLIKRDNISIDEAEKRIKSQMQFEYKRKFADYIIDNSREIEYTKKQVNRILEKIVFMEDIND